MLDGGKIKGMKKMSKQNRISALLIAMVMIIAMLAFDIPNGMSMTKAESSTKYPYKDPSIHIQGLIQNNGWQQISNDGIAGTTGRTLKLEALKIGVFNNVDKDGNKGKYEGQIEVRIIGFDSRNCVYTKQAIVNCDSMSNMCGLEGGSIYSISISLKGEIKSLYNIKYRVHVQNLGWQPWVMNGEYAFGQNKKQMEAIESIEVQLVRNQRDWIPDQGYDPPSQSTGEGDLPSTSVFMHDKKHEHYTLSTK